MSSEFSKESYLYNMVEFPQESPVKNLALLARQVVEGFLIGLHKSPFHGFSVEFAEHRLYNSGDNLKYLDWKVFARSDKMFVKKFEEETNLRCCLAIDTSSSMYFKSDGLSKMEFSCLTAAALSYLLKKQMDACSLALFDEALYHLTPAKAGSKHHQQIIKTLQQLLAPQGTNKNTNLAKSLHSLADRLHQRSLVVIFSDIPQSIEEGEKLAAALQHLRYNKHEVLVFHVVDKQKEIDLNFENRPYTFEDLETGELVKLNPAEYQVIFTQKMQEYREFIREQCLKYKVDYMYCDMSQSPKQALHQFLIKRNKMM